MCRDHKFKIADKFSCASKIRRKGWFIMFVPCLDMVVATEVAKGGKVYKYQL